MHTFVSVYLFAVGVFLVGLATFDHAASFFLTKKHSLPSRDFWSRTLIEIALGSALIIVSRVLP